jgi:3-oxoacyl-[acyl-carrier protein] reductase
MHQSCYKANDEAAQRQDHQYGIDRRRQRKCRANYVAAKAGVIGLTKTTAKELASRGITVNAIAPGFISTDMTGELPEDVQKAMLDQIPLARFGDPKDIAAVASFLASDASKYMTGQTLHVDGGMVM